MIKYKQIVMKPSSVVMVLVVVMLVVVVVLVQFLTDNNLTIELFCIALGCGNTANHD